MKRTLSLTTALFALLVFGAAPLVGCSDDDVGIRCDLGSDEESTTSGTQFNLRALDCRSRICVQFVSGGAGSSQPRCTQVCESDDDCPSDGVGTCTSGFVCRTGSAVGDFKCCKICVCSDDLSDPTRDEQAQLCASLPENEKAKCPQL